MKDQLTKAITERRILAREIDHGRVEAVAATDGSEQAARLACARFDITHRAILDRVSELTSLIEALTANREREMIAFLRRHTAAVEANTAAWQEMTKQPA